METQVREPLIASPGNTVNVCVYVLCICVGRGEEGVLLESEDSRFTQDVDKF